MESTFLSKENIDNIYEYLNTQTVREYNLNLDSDEKYRKIVKKLSKTIYKQLYTTIKNMNVNEFNDLVVNKSMPFIKQNLTRGLVNKPKMNTNDVKNFNTHDINYSSVDMSTLNNIDLSSSVKLVGNNEPKKIEKKSKKPKKKSNNEEYESYLEDAVEFENLIKQSNSKIKDNFKKLVKTTQNNFVKECDIQDTNKFVMDRCAAKDNVIEKGLSKLAFEEIIESKTRNNLDINRDDSNTLYPSTSATNTISSMVDDTNPVSNNGDNTYDNTYDNTNMNYKQLFSQILVNQNDHSKDNKIDSYEGEMYLPNLIGNYGSEAPIQPLLYQNTSKGSEIINTFSIIVDSGSTNNSINTVEHTGTNKWQNFSIDLEDTLKIDKLTDVYLKSFTVYGATSMGNCLYYVLDIEEFNLRNHSNNEYLKSKILIQNTVSTSAVNSVLTKGYSKLSNYISTLTPTNLTVLNIVLTNQDGQGSDNASLKTFHDRTSTANRVIFELDFVSRVMKDPIFDYTVTKDTAEMVSNA
jgi:hypothetical protein